MTENLNLFQKQNSYLICVDSDGCAMDAMDIKHTKCFGPCMVAEWNLFPWEGPILQRWNEINLYSKDRGINRFKGLVKALKEINRHYTPIEDLPSLIDWTKKTSQLSNQALKATIATHPSIALKKALTWSCCVNKAVAALPPEAITPFSGVQRSLLEASCQADLVMVSSANRDAVTEEWTRYGLVDSLNLILAQDNGSKASCISALLLKGYPPQNVLMVGDAPGDLAAARDNKVFFYPILAGKEEESWHRFRDTILPAFLSGRYKQLESREEKHFWKNLSGS